MVAFRSVVSCEVASDNIREPARPPVVERRLRPDAEYLRLRTTIAEKAPQGPVESALKAEDLGQPDLASDCWILAGDVRGARDVMASSPLGRTLTHYSQRRLNLTLMLGEPPSVRDLLAMANTPFTRWVLSHQEDTETQLELVFAEHEWTVGPLEAWLLGRPGTRWSIYWTIFEGTRAGKQADGIRTPWLYGNRQIQGFLKEAAPPQRTVRERRVVYPISVKAGFPRRVYRLIEAEIGSTVNVVHHGRPEGLGRQHLDVWIPEWKVAVEFQGDQHDRPVGFFGGDEAFEPTSVPRRAQATGL